MTHCLSPILGIAEYVLGADDEYVYLLVLPSDCSSWKTILSAASANTRHCKATHKAYHAIFEGQRNPHK